jgi:hypothetical protein
MYAGREYAFVFTDKHPEHFFDCLLAAKKRKKSNWNAAWQAPFLIVTALCGPR